jgi:pteridine reductase
MKMKTAMVTGAARRIGRAVALHLAKNGYRVAVHCHGSADAGAALVKTIEAAGGAAFLVQGNLQDEQRCATMVQEVRSQMPHVNVLVNSASTFTEDNVLSFSFDSLRDHMMINAFAPLLLSRSFACDCAVDCIVNFLDSRVVDYDDTHASYHLSKRTFDDITRMLAVELAPDVRVNAVAPGLILPPEGKGDDYVEMRRRENLLQRQGTLDEICMAVDFLVNNEFVTGQTVFVDGGRHLKGAFYR